MTDFVFHYTDDSGYKAINSQPAWVFKATQPPADHPFGAYFTTLAPTTANLAKRLRVPKSKLAFLFCFVGRSDLEPLSGRRGDFIFFSPTDYTVEVDRQVFHGPIGTAAEKLR
jgi:hypothetical protein